MICLVTMIAFLVIGPLAIFTFEMNRVGLATQQLKNALDVAALTAAATLASEQNPDTAQAQTNAIAAGMDLLRGNFILNHSLNSAQLALPAGSRISDTSIQVQMYDSTTHQKVAIGDPRGKVFSFAGSFTLETAFGKYLGIPQCTIAAVSNSALPKLDLIFCFDLSASMDDQTPISLIKRKWDSQKQKIVYDRVAQGREHTLTNSQNLGSTLVAIPPMNLSLAYFDNHYLFSEYYAQQMRVPGLRALGGIAGVSDAGLPPGNAPGGSAPVYDGSLLFTDMVANIDGNDAFQGVNRDGYAFPDVATLVEAARGNLENQSVFLSSKANTGVPSNVQPRAGYQAKYMELALSQMQPLQQAKAESQQFLSSLRNQTDLHVSLVGFGDYAGSAGDAGQLVGTLDMPAPFGSGYGPKQNYKPAFVGLNRTADQISAVKTAIGGCTPSGGTATGDAISRSLDQLTTEGRADAMKVVVLFTDGIATVSPGERQFSGPPPYAGPTLYARQMATRAKTSKIPIYTIGLSQNQSIVPLEFDLLNDQNRNTDSGGIAGISGGSYYPIANTADLKSAFGKLTRELARLVYTP